MLRPQLFVSDNGSYNPNKITPIKNANVKPRGGLWTSTFDVQYKNRWVEFCEYDFTCNVPDNRWDGYILIPHKRARIYTVNSHKDLMKLLEKYPYQPYRNMYGFPFLAEKLYPDFERIKRDYDAIRITDEGQWATRLTEPGLYGWDFESTLWFRDCFTKVIHTTFKTYTTIHDEVVA